MKPLVLGYDRVVFCDVDDTLVTFNFNPTDLNKCVLVGPPGFEKYALPMTGNIENLKNARTRGHGVVVWSQGGFSWAKAVVEALKLEEYVDLVVTKPNWIYDDLPVEKWIGPRFYQPAYGDGEQK